MSHSSRWAIALAVIAIIVLVVKSYSRPGAERIVESRAAKSRADGFIRITPQRIPLAEELMTLCLSPETRYGPHAGTVEVHICANGLALDYRRDHSNEYDYPVGSKFMKEKYPFPGDDNPDAATIMERTGTNGDVSDWTFSMISLPNRTPLKPSGSMTCAECHEHYKDTGFVSSDSESVIRKYLEIE